jgi:3-hydroxymyristoyl/3-hydroxydecanoyl-(acyl carrier protein) dehydratase
MPAAPSVVPESPLPPRGRTASQIEQVPYSHPMEAHHDRVSSIHTHFLRLQEQVHSDFLLHRHRLLEGLEQLLAQGLTTGSASELQAHAGAQPSVDEDLARELVTHVREVSRGDWFIDSHVVPAGLLLTPLGDVARRRSGVLECEAEYLGALPGPGDSIVTEVVRRDDTDEVRFEIDGFVREANRPVVRLRGRFGSAGAADAPRWDIGDPPAKPSLTWTRKRQFAETDLAAVFGGDLLACFGKGFERTSSHTRTPPLPGAALVRLTSVSVVDPEGGARAAGLLRAHVTTSPEDVPPSTEDGLSFARVVQGAFQTLAFFVVASGGTIDRDGWRFEPLEGHACRLKFMGNPGPETSLDYELVVEQLTVGPRATIIGDVKAWAGDTLVFQGDRLALRLVPDFPLSSDLDLQADGVAEEALGRQAAEIEGFRIGYSSLLAGALGRPSEAFREPGGFFETGERTMPRLPGPPYHFITRITAVSGERLSMRPGAEGTFEYDVPPDAWYFDESGTRSMPFCVLLEAALQPCGWLSVYVGCPLATSEDVYFRNLDGSKMSIALEIRPDSGTLRTHAKVISVTHVSGIMILSYRIECSLGERLVCKLDATFGYFPKEALAAQAGLATTDEQRGRLTIESPLRVDLSERQPKYFAGPLRLPGPVLLMMDRVTGFWEAGGPTGKGLLRAEKDVKPSDWFFKAHFYSDPVQPGSLGLEMMLQLMQFFLIEKDLGKGIDQPYFEPLASNSPVAWKFRGQVRPSSLHIVVDVEIVSIESLPDSVTLIANGSLWVDGVRCYEAKGMGVRIRGGRPAAARPPSAVETTIDPTGADRWVADHRPSHTVPVMPMMSMVDRLAGASLAYVRAAYPAIGGSPGWVIVGGDEFRAHGWLVCDVPKRLRTEVKLLKGRASTRVDELDAAAALYEVAGDGSPPRRVASGRVRLGRRYAPPPRAWSPLADGVRVGTPYETGAIGHGPALQIIQRIAYGSRGASADLDAGKGTAPIGALHQVLLDGALQAIPHDELELWSDKIPKGHVGVPVRTSARFFGPPPETGIVRLELRFIGFDGGTALPTFGIQMIDPRGTVWATLRHVELLVPTGHEASLRHQRVPFLVEKKYVEGACLSRFHADRTELADADVKRMDWMPGSVVLVYGLERGVTIDNRVIAIKDHVAHRLRVHPARVQVNASCSEGLSEDPPGRFPVSVELRGADVIVRDAPPPHNDLESRHN